MCTVTFIPVRDHFIITSNRDENCNRKAAIPPALHRYQGWKLVFPTDAEAGGTWIALKENGDAAVLLNGAFIKHRSEPPYRKSRGTILPDILATPHPSYTFSRMDLQEIEPFTVVLFEKGSLYQFRWDGTEKYCKQLPTGRPHIWSSSTLYDGLVIKRREQWLAAFLNRIPLPTQQDILNFHRFAGDGDITNDILMNRNGIYSTVSITSLFLTADKASMKYVDLKANKLSETKISLINATSPI